jgi:prevent-host-death family protein
VFVQVVQGTNYKGALAEAEIAAAATRLGVTVLKPLADHGRYDLVFEVGSRLLRVQCKSGALHRPGGVIRVNLQTSWLTPHGYVRNSYAEDEIDCVAVYCSELDRCYLLSSARVAGRRSIYLRLSPPQNAQRACINLAKDFDFAGAVAQLGERSDGIRQVRGSSPLSSTPLFQSFLETVVGANRFRNHFGHYMERSAGGEEILITRHGKPFVRLVPASDTAIQADPEPGGAPTATDGSNLQLLVT